MFANVVKPVDLRYSRSAGLENLAIRTGLTQRKRELRQLLEFVHQWPGRKGRLITTAAVRAADPQK
jgi:hypothetical protein